MSTRTQCEVTRWVSAANAVVFAANESIQSALSKRNSQNCTTRIKARKAESQDGVLEDGQAASPSPPAIWSGERIRSLSGVWGGASDEIEFGIVQVKNLASGDYEYAA